MNTTNGTVPCEALLHAVDSWLFVVRPDTGEMLFANRAFQSAFGEVAVGDDYVKFLGVDLQGAQGDIEFYCDRVGEWLRATREPVSWADVGDAWLVTLHETTTKKRYLDSVERLAFQDHLTHLPNRYRCDIDLLQACSESRAAGRSGYLFFIDMDDFKIVNDRYGHDYGDGVLISFADYLQDTFKAPDKVFRFGGDEFVILISHKNADSVETYLQRLLERAAEPWQSMDKQFFCTLSIGVVAFTGFEESIKSIVKNADIAMYEAKRRGKNQYERYRSGLDEETVQRSTMESLIRRAMAGDFKGFAVYYQPVVNAVTGEIAGAEALLRMLDDDGSIILPREFLPLAEYLGFMVPIGEFVMREAFGLCRTINEGGRPGFRMTVNLSEKQLRQKDIVRSIEDIVTGAGVRIGNVEIAMNESGALETPERMMTVSDALRAGGMSIALDDFGGGNASFTHMHNLPVDIIKTAPSFIGNIGEAYTRDFLQLIVKWCHSTGKRVCVTGVETPEQQAFCREVGIDLLQGFFLHIPYDRNTLTSVLAEK